MRPQHDRTLTGVLKQKSSDPLDSTASAIHESEGEGFIGNDCDIDLLVINAVYMFVRTHPAATFSTLS